MPVLFTYPQQITGPFTNRVFGPFTVPNATRLILTTNIVAADLADSTKSLSVLTRIAHDGVTFDDSDSMTWVGGALDKHGNPAGNPIMTESVDPSEIGKPAQVIVTIPSALNIGFTVSY
jgi:hypothetical protein